MGRIHAIQVGHGDVHDDHIGYLTLLRQVLNDPNRCLTILRLCHHGHVRLLIQFVPQVITMSLVVLSQDNGDGHVGFSCLRSCVHHGS